MIDDRLPLVRSALFLPASNARAIEKAQRLAADLVILDLEDAVPAELKEEARVAAVAAAATDWTPLLAIRVNAPDRPEHAKDLAALAGVPADVIVVPKVERADDLAVVRKALGRPLLAMIETPKGLYAARDIAAEPGVVGLIAGSNDLAAELRLPPRQGREGLALALQMILLAARAAGGIALDGVWNRLDDADGFAEDCAQGRALGFEAKTLIHPNQIETCNRLFGPDTAELEDAQALIAAATGGAERFRGRMIEAMHVAQAHRTIARAR
ncbi:citrate lyase subunit beta/citryl-CoA lyase [Sphingomonas vulcanisoli]|uniref:Citrate lyase subunit beta/citryl-CoA lyase n=1 Tax=Sphingomonas vulcanisoli TaxID=1658060 RepID=A0ABX0TNG2_9SPHN|nr:CoA ester lyase [Sphingomonas vulcanisoli]NIJ07057.1 citrate lyase subunit beta/citryl-CoA lyase [Sphingomonas vulcanisoli]